MAALQVTVAEDVPLLRPIARDDRVRAEEVTEEVTVDVEVLANDEDPDGTKSGLDVVSGPAQEARVLATARCASRSSEQQQLITYTITDVDGQTASAFVHVPAHGELPPTLTRPSRSRSER